MANKFHLLLIVLISILSFSNTLFAQSRLLQLDIKQDLMEKSDQDQELSSLSNDDYLKAGFSIYKVKKEDIHLMGAQFIPDILKNVPGMIVRPINRSTYDVEYMGGANLRTAGYLETMGSNSIGIMIDGVIYNDPVNGYIFWENLPISIENIESLTVIDFSSGAWYGMEAYSCLIQIESKKVPNKGQEFIFQIGTFSSNDLLFTDSKIAIHYNKKINSKISLHTGASFLQIPTLDSTTYVFSKKEHQTFNNAIESVPQLGEIASFGTTSIQQSKVYFGMDYQLPKDNNKMSFMLHYNKAFKFAVGNGQIDNIAQNQNAENLFDFRYSLSILGFKLNSNLYSRVTDNVGYLGYNNDLRHYYSNLEYHKVKWNGVNIIPSISLSYNNLTGKSSPLYNNEYDFYSVYFTPLFSSQKESFYMISPALKLQKDWENLKSHFALRYNHLSHFKNTNFNALLGLQWNYSKSSSFNLELSKNDLFQNAMPTFFDGKQAISRYPTNQPLVYQTINDNVKTPHLLGSYLTWNSKAGDFLGFKAKIYYQHTSNLQRVDITKSEDEHKYTYININEDLKQLGFESQITINYGSGKFFGNFAKSLSYYNLPKEYDYLFSDTPMVIQICWSQYFFYKRLSTNISFYGIQEHKMFDRYGVQKIIDQQFFGRVNINYNFYKKWHLNILLDNLLLNNNSVGYYGSAPMLSTYGINISYNY